jgi:hypothetical protein
VENVEHTSKDHWSAWLREVLATGSEGGPNTSSMKGHVRPVQCACLRASGRSWDKANRFFINEEQVWVIFLQLHEEIRNSKTEKAWSWLLAPPFSWSEVLRVEGV